MLHQAPADMRERIRQIAISCPLHPLVSGPRRRTCAWHRPAISSRTRTSATSCPTARAGPSSARPTARTGTASTSLAGRSVAGRAHATASTTCGRATAARPSTHPSSGQGARSSTGPARVERNRSAGVSPCRDRPTRRRVRVADTLSQQSRVDLRVWQNGAEHVGGTTMSTT